MKRAVEPMTCSREHAEALTRAIGEGIDDLGAKLLEVVQRRAWAALDYPSVEAWWTDRVMSRNVTLRADERRELVAVMADAGLSDRALGSILGVDHKTVGADRKALRGESSPREAVQIDPLDGKIIPEPSSSRTGVSVLAGAARGAVIAGSDDELTRLAVGQRRGEPRHRDLDKPLERRACGALGIQIHRAQTCPEGQPPQHHRGAIRPT